MHRSLSLRYVRHVLKVGYIVVEEILVTVEAQKVDVLEEVKEEEPVKQVEEEVSAEVPEESKKEEEVPVPEEF